MKKGFKWLLVLSAVLAGLFLLGAQAGAMPALEAQRQYSQPGGEKFTATEVGDEFFHYTKASTGDIIEKGADGAWYYAGARTFQSNGRPAAELVSTGAKFLIDKKPRSAVAEDDLGTAFRYLAEEEAQRVQAMQEEESAGLQAVAYAQKLLIILVDFSDVNILYESQWANRIFGVGVNSVRDYYREATYGKVDFQPCTESYVGAGKANDGIVRVSLGRAHPNPSSTGSANYKISYEAIKAANSYVNFKNCDTDGNGTIDPDELHIYVVTAGYEESYNSSTPSVWGHRSSGTLLTNGWFAGATSFLGDFGFGGKMVGAYTQCGERQGSHMATIGIFCHELGHDLGLPDLYNTNSDSTGAGLGGYSLMANGSWGYVSGDSGSSPVHFDAYCLQELGIVTPTQVTTNGTWDGNLRSYKDSSGKNILKISTSVSSQYYLIENREPVGYDQGMNRYLSSAAKDKGGVAIYRVDTSYSKNLTAGQQLVTFLESDGKGRLDAGTTTSMDALYYVGTGRNPYLNRFTNPSTVLKNGSYAWFGAEVKSSYASSMRVVIGPGPTAAYTVTYDYSENGGTSATLATATVPAGLSVSLSPTASKSSWTFVGWNTNKDATTALSSYTMPSNNVTLYAIFKRTFTGTFIDYSAATKTTRTVSADIFNKATAGAVTVPAQNTYTGWTARGWTTGTAANAAVEVSSGTSYTLSANVTFYGLYQRQLTLSYDTAGGSAAPASQSVTQYTNSYAVTTLSPASSAMTLAAAPTKAACDFVGWSVNGTTYAAGTSVSISASVTATAVWQGRFHTVTYNYSENDGTSVVQGSASVQEGAAVPLTFAATKPSWDFVGWNTDKDAITGLTALTMNTTDITLFAIYRRTLTATFIDCGGTNTISDTIYNKATSITVTAPAAAARAGWTVRGWGLQTAANAPVSLMGGSSYAITADVTFYGLYQRTLTITFDSNGGAPTPPARTGTQYANSYNLVASLNPSFLLPKAPEDVDLPGYYLAGWTEGGMSTVYGAGSDFAIEQDTTMRASWVLIPPVTHTVTYNHRENGGVSANTSVDVPENTEISLAPIAEKTGWNFLGWNTDRNALTGLTSLHMDTANVTLFAIFSKTLTATFVDHDNNALVTRAFSTTIYNKTASWEITTPAQNNWPGWTTRGWGTQTAPTANAAVSGGSSYAVANDATFYGLYRRTLTLSYNTLGGSSAPASQTGMQYVNVYDATAYASPTLVLAGAVTKTGFNFTGWAHPGGTLYGAGANITIAENTVMSAAWEAIRHNVQYNYSENGGSSVTLASTLAAEGDAIPLYSQAAKPGWDFIGWNTDKNATEGLLSLTMGTADVELFAIYSKILTATFIDTGATREVTVTIYNKASAGEAAAPEQNEYPGWTARGWSTATAANAAPAASFSVSADTTFYGLYQRTLVLSYGTGSGSLAPDSQEGTQYLNSFNSTARANPTLTLAGAAARSGFLFLGWAENSASGTEYSAGASITIAENTVMIALWEELPPVTHVVTYNYAENGGTASAVNVNIAEGEEISLSPQAAKSGWNFVGWNTDKDATEGLDLLAMGGSDVELFAIYSKTITLTFIDYGAGKVTRTSTVKLYNKATAATAVPPTQNAYSGWTARGWSTATAANAAPAASFSVSADTTFYGLYQRTLTVSYNTQGGGTAPASQTGTQYANSYDISLRTNPSITLAGAAAKSGYTFEGWAQGSVSGQKYGAGAAFTPSESVTMHAVWESSGQASLFPGGVLTFQRKQQYNTFRNAVTAYRAQTGNGLRFSSAKKITVDGNGNITYKFAAIGRTTVYAYDAATNAYVGQVEVNVVWNFWQWLLVIFLFGWIYL